MIVAEPAVGWCLSPPADEIRSLQPVEIDSVTGLKPAFHKQI